MRSKKEKAQEEIKDEKKADEKEIARANEVFEMLMEGKDLTHTVKTGRGAFTFRYPSGSDTLAMARKRSEMLEGINLESADSETLLFVDAVAAIEETLVEAPKWWKGARNCPDRRLIGELYRGYLRRVSEVQGLLRICEVGRDDEGAGAGKREASAVGDRAFPLFAN